MKVLSVMFLVAFASNGLAQNSVKVHVTVLYESLCPDSINFIQSQLKPSYHHLKDIVDIVFVPFGKSMSLNTKEFICQHGEKECIGNKIQSCALNRLDDQSSQVAYVACQMAPNADIHSPKCSELVGLNYEDVVNCFNSEEGTKLQLNAEVITSQIAPKFIPTILYNHHFDQTLQDRSLTDFAGVVYDLIKGAEQISSESQLYEIQ